MEAFKCITVTTTLLLFNLSRNFFFFFQVYSTLVIYINIYTNLFFSLCHRFYWEGIVDFVITISLHHSCKRPTYQQMSTDVKDHDDFDNSALPPLRIKRKLLADRFVRINRSVDEHREKDSSPHSGGKEVVPFKQTAFGAPCSLSTSIKFAEMVHQQWKPSIILPTMLSSKNASKFRTSESRYSHLRLKSRSCITKSSQNLANGEKVWFESTSLMSNLFSFLSEASIFNMFLVCKSVNNTLRSDEMWVSIIDRYGLAPLATINKVEKDYYEFFKRSIVTTKVLDGLFVFENPHSPSPTFNFSLATIVFETPEHNSVPDTDGGDIEADQSKYQDIRLMVTPTTFGSSIITFSRAYLLLRRWPPFDQAKVFLGACRFSLRHKGFIFTFLDQFSEPEILLTCMFNFSDEGEDGEENQNKALLMSLVAQGNSGEKLEISRFVLSRVKSPAE